jgi:hypothetical protein
VLCLIVLGALMEGRLAAKAMEAVRWCAVLCAITLASLT